jgi:hypothetical protein
MYIFITPVFVPRVARFYSLRITVLPASEPSLKRRHLQYRYIPVSTYQGILVKSGATHFSYLAGKAWLGVPDEREGLPMNKLGIALEEGREKNSKAGKATNVEIQSPKMLEA